MRTPEYYERFAQEDGSTFLESEMVCPYCYQEQQDLFDISGAYEDGDGETICQYCEKEFEFDTRVEITWSTYRKESEEE